MAFWDTPDVLSGTIGVPTQQSGPLPKVDLGLSIIHTGSNAFVWTMNFKQLQMPSSYAWMVNSNMPYDCAREVTVRALLPYNPKWIFSLDTDVLTPPDALMKLIKLAEDNNKDIVSGMYWAKKRETFNMPAAWLKTGEDKAANKVTYAAVDIKQWLDKNALITCDVVGAGCLLVRTSVFTRLDQSDPKKPFFQWGLTRKDELTGLPLKQMSEDFYLMERCKNELNIFPHLATDVKCGHICTVQKRPADGEFELI